MFLNVSTGIYQSMIKNAPRHEFLGKPYNFKLPNSLKDLELRIGLPVFSLKQVHGNKIIDLRSSKWNEGLEGDGILAERRNSSPCAIGVFTADCLPILIWNSNLVAALHAGWRGVASGIIELAIKSFEGNDPVTVLIGPCAGGNSYEVGAEVIQQIGESASYKKIQSKIFLDLAGTVKNKLNKKSLVETKILGECTMTNVMFHSHRREGENRGSNFSWISAE